VFLALYLLCDTLGWKCCKRGADAEYSYLDDDDLETSDQVNVQRSGKEDQGASHYSWTEGYVSDNDSSESVDGDSYRD
jgi:hypothetical protein